MSNISIKPKEVRDMLIVRNEQGVEVDPIADLCDMYKKFKQVLRDVLSKRWDTFYSFIKASVKLRVD